MRPRRFRRGIRGGHPARRQVRHRFNEAPAISPGNSAGSSASPRSRSRFNEAPAISPGNSVRRDPHRGVVGVASMRPRRFRRGIHRAARRRPRAPARFNEAPAISPGNSDIYVRLVRRRRQCFNEAPAISPGNSREGPDEPGLRGGASMRPRRFRRGIPDRTVGAFRTSPARFNEAPAISPGNSRPGRRGTPLARAASMRPRRFRRGIRPAEGLTVAQLTALQ